MPSVSSILNMARLMCNKTASMSGLSDSDLLPLLNTLVYARVQETIRKRVDGEYFSYEFTTNIVDDEPKYQIPQADNTTPGVLKIIEVAIKEESTSDYYTVIYEKGTKHIDNYTDYEASNATTPYYDKRGGYIYLYPTPTENITNGLKILASVTLPDLTTGSTEADIFPNHQQLRVYHSVLVNGMKAVIYGISGDNALKQEAQADYERDLDNMVLALQKGQEPTVGESFTGSHYR